MLLVKYSNTLHSKLWNKLSKTHTQRERLQMKKKDALICLNWGCQYPSSARQTPEKATSSWALSCVHLQSHTAGADQGLLRADISEKLPKKVGCTGTRGWASGRRGVSPCRAEESHEGQEGAAQGKEPSVVELQAATQQSRASPPWDSAHAGPDSLSHVNAENPQHFFY